MLLSRNTNNYVMKNKGENVSHFPFQLRPLRQTLTLSVCLLPKYHQRVSLLVMKLCTVFMATFDIRCTVVRIFSECSCADLPTVFIIILVVVIIIITRRHLFIKIVRFTQLRTDCSRSAMRRHRRLTASLISCFLAQGLQSVAEVYI
jgi:hypothetical protein